MVRREVEMGSTVIVEGEERHDAGAGRSAALRSGVTRALVTGATGLVGSHIVERLLADGWSVRALVRDPRAASWLGDAGAELARGDLVERGVAAQPRWRAATRCFHCAALIAATRRLGELSAREHRWHARGRRCGGQRRARGSCTRAASPCTVRGARYRSTPTDEDTPLAPLDEYAYYARSKRESEQLVLDAHARGRALGDGDSPTNDLRQARSPARAAVRTRDAHGLLPAVRARPFDHVARARIRRRGRRGARRTIRWRRRPRVQPRQRFSGDASRTSCSSARMGSVAPCAACRFRRPLARATFAALALGARVSRGRRQWRRSFRRTVDTFSRDNPFTSERARRELGWSPTVRPEVGIPDAFAWWREHQLVTDESAAANHVDTRALGAQGVGGARRRNGARRSHRNDPEGWHPREARGLRRAPRSLSALSHLLPRKAPRARRTLSFDARCCARGSAAGGNDPAALRRDRRRGVAGDGARAAARDRRGARAHVGRCRVAISIPR